MASRHYARSAIMVPRYLTHSIPPMSGVDRCRMLVLPTTPPPYRPAPKVRQPISAPHDDQIPIAQATARTPRFPPSSLIRRAGRLTSGLADRSVFGRRPARRITLNESRQFRPVLGRKYRFNSGHPAGRRQAPPSGGLAESVRRDQPWAGPVCYASMVRATGFRVGRCRASPRMTGSVPVPRAAPRRADGSATGRAGRRCPRPG